MMFEMEYNLSQVEKSWFWYRSKLIKRSDEYELESCNEIQLLWLNELAIELINGLNVNRSNVKELI